MAEGHATPGNKAGASGLENLSGKGFSISIGKTENVVIGNHSTIIVHSTSKSCGPWKKEKIAPKFPVTDSTELITMDEKLDIKGKVGRSWKELGSRLEFEDAELEQLELDYRHDKSELIYQIITKWQQRTTQRASRAALAKVFMKMKRGDLADILARRHKSN